jgi:hypothetical protein
MKKTTVLLVSLLAVLLANCRKETLADNPFLSPYQTPFEVPPFD